MSAATDREVRLQQLLLRLGVQVKAARQRNRMTQQYVAESIGYTRSSLANLEAGRQHPSLFTFLELAEVLGVTPPELLAAPPSNRAKTREVA